MATKECFSFQTTDGHNGCLSHAVYFPGGPITAILFQSDYSSVRVGHEHLEKIANEDDPTGTLLAVARNRHFFGVSVQYGA